MKYNEADEKKNCPGGDLKSDFLNNFSTQSEQTVSNDMLYFKLIEERMSNSEIEIVMPNDLVNPKPASASIREFFGSNPLSQFMDQTNPLAELTHKRRLSVLGPGGITRDRAGFAVRDIHPSQYGRICPVETPEGPNAGLIGSLSTYGRINSYGFIETPFYEVKQGHVIKKDFPIYLNATKEDQYRLAAGDLLISEKN